MSGSRPAWASLGFDLVSLRVFVAAIEEKSLTAAALREGIAVSAVSRRISELEHRSGVILLDRHERGVVPTFAGQRLIEQLDHIFTLFDAIGADMEEIRGGRCGLVRVVSHMSALSSGLAERLAGFVTAHPGIAIEVEECTSAEASHAVQTGMADVGLISGTASSRGLCVLPWEEDELIVLLPKGHKLASEEGLHFRDLLREPFVGMQRDSALQELFREKAEAVGEPLQERSHATSFDSAARMVAAGLGVAIIPRSAAAALAAGGRVEIRALKEDWARRRLLLCMRSGGALSPAVRKFVSHMTMSDQEDCLAQSTIDNEAPFAICLAAED